MQVDWFDISSPLGTIALRIEHAQLTGVYFVGQKHFPSGPPCSWLTPSLGASR